ncbi:MAG: hypothetical protein WCF18_17960, partial [Chthoniobacteraceae bacterium]
ALGSIQFSGHWSVNTKSIRAAEMSLLALAAEDLDEIVPERIVEQKELEALRDELTALRSDIGVAVIDAKLKALLLSEISRLMDSLVDYHITGAGGMKEAAATAIGRLYVDKDILVPARESKEVTRTYTLVGRIADVAAVAQMSIQLGWNGAQLISGLLGS